MARTVTITPNANRYGVIAISVVVNAPTNREVNMILTKAAIIATHRHFELQLVIKSHPFINKATFLLSNTIYEKNFPKVHK